MNNFHNLCDAICLYDDAPVDLENNFKSLIYSFKSTLKWYEYINIFPGNLQKKILKRFESI